MAVQFGTCRDVWIPFTDPERLATIPQGTLSDPYEVTDTDLIVPPVRSNVFPTPPAAFGFLIDVIGWDSSAFDGLMPGGLRWGAVYPESRYLEPTIGQIWPR